MKRLWKLARPLTLVMVLAALCVVPQQAAADDDDPPSRVARLSYVRGSVSFQPAGEEEWVSAVVNRPFTTGDKLWADQGARAELHIGSAAIRLGEDTGFSFLDLNDRVTQIRVTAGTVYVRVRELNPDEMFEVDTPNLAFSLLRAGEYRIDVNEAGDVTRVTVRGGEGEVTGGGEAFTVHAGQTAEFRGNDQLDTAFDTVASRDDFDDWCVERNGREDRARSAQYVSRDVIGYEDLDDYGEWRTESEYGHVWRPRTVVVGWAPYRYGHWAWIYPWGWTWVDDAPWGFAPFHYGRWVFVGGYWGWVPCPARVRPVYAPALVAWVGGSNFSIGISVGRGPAVGWFPLGPREVFIPSYRVSPRYVTNINVTNTTVNNVYVTNVYNNYTTNRVTNIRYVNRERVTVTSQTAFTSAQPVGRNMVHMDRRQLEAGQVTPGLSVTPQQRAVFGAGNPGARRPPERVMTREVVAKTTPPPRPVPFATQRKAIEANSGRMPDRQQIERMRSTGDEGARRNVRMAPPIRSAGERRGPGNVRPAPPVTPATPQTAKPMPARPERPEPRREDRPAEVRREERPAPQPAERPAPKAGEERPAGQPADRPRAMPNDRPDRPTKSPRQIEREEQLQQKQQQEQQKLQQRQEQENQRLEQKHQEQEQKARQQAEGARQQQEQKARQQAEGARQQQEQRAQQAENARQQQEHQRQAQRQEQERQRMDQRQQQQREKVQKQEAKQKQKEEKKQKPEKPRDERPPGR